MTKKMMIFMGSLLFSTGVLAGSSTGQILEISFASSIATTTRPGTAQFSIEGGFEATGDCNQNYAAISNEDTHLISLLLMAKAQNKEIEVFLDSTNKYHTNRCLVNYIELQ